MYAVVIEWGDGTVVVNGPYGSKDAAWQATRTLAEEIAAEDEMPIQGDIGALREHYVLGEDGMDQIDVYAVKMGEPVKVEQ